MHATHDKTNTGEMSLDTIKHYIAQAESETNPPQGLVIQDIELPRWFIYIVLFSAAVILVIVLAFYIGS